MIAADTRPAGAPTASAEAVSPLRMLNANGKLLAANASTGPMGSNQRSSCGRGGVALAWAASPHLEVPAVGRHLGEQAQLARRPRAVGQARDRQAGSGITSGRSSAACASSRRPRTAGSTWRNTSDAAAATARISPSCSRGVSATGEPTGARPCGGQLPGRLLSSLRTHRLRSNRKVLIGISLTRSRMIPRASSSPSWRVATSSAR